MTTIDQAYRLQARQHEIWRRLKAGSLTAEDVLAATQGILDGIYPSKPAKAQPLWYDDPAIRLERAHQANAQRKWGFGKADFPDCPADTSKLWLLVINLPDKGKVKGLQRTVDEFWELIKPPTGYSKYRDPEFKTDPDHLRQAPGYDYRPGIYWVEFDPEAYRGKSPKVALVLAKADNVALVGPEGFAAIWQFPDWPSSWNGDTSPFPNLSGLQFYWNTDWSGVPYLDRWGGSRQLGLSAGWADYVHSNWSSPSVREC